jgi:hypothetical protein
VICEGATALAASCNDPHVANDARAAAATLLKAALQRPDDGHGPGPLSGGCRAAKAPDQELK